MIDETSITWTYSKNVDKFKEAPPIRDLAEKDPSAVGYLISMFNIGSEPEEVLGKYRDAYAQAISLVDKSQTELDSNE